LCEHLIERFPDLTTQAVIEEVARCRRAVESFGLVEQDQLETGEVLARHSLLISTGEVADVARLDPESHTGRPALPVN
jgi:hypothetical protein